MRKSTYILGACLLLSQQITAFCGFYVAKADATLFNNRSEVILVRDGNWTAVTMSNDFEGDVDDFAMVVPVPVVLKETDIRTVNPNVFSKLDAYSGPRLVEYYDDNPCFPIDRLYSKNVNTGSARIMNKSSVLDDAVEKEYKVTIEAEYKVDEYDILILSATESDGLKRWLTDNGYKIPKQAEEVLDPYIQNNLKFFVVKINAERFASSGYQKLKPIQIKYESPKFMLPIRLGMANSKGEQDMIVYAFSKKGRIEATNYRTVKIPTNRNIPTFIKNDFGRFYKDVFDKEYSHQGKNAVFLEYAWNVSPRWPGVKCDPCVGPPPIYKDLAEAGIEWNMQNEGVFFTRLHVRYSKNKFPQDLLFQVTPNKEHFQGRYILTNPATGELNCKAGQNYLVDLVNRRQNELSEMEVLAGWDANDYGYYTKSYSRMIKDNEKRNDVITPITSPSGNNNTPKLIFTLGLLLAVILFLSGIFNPKRKPVTSV